MDLDIIQLNNINLIPLIIRLGNINVSPSNEPEEYCKQIND